MKCAYCSTKIIVILRKPHFSCTRSLLTKSSQFFVYYVLESNTGYLIWALCGFCSGWFSKKKAKTNKQVGSRCGPDLRANCIASTYAIVHFPVVMQLCVIQFVIDLLQVGGFLWVLLCTPLIKLTGITEMLLKVDF